ncbi:hypothetical protein [Tenacibaculum ovolyticum]|uniref:hypothetical protein n=1 Tax=Tenacibaculum ovolyticum TaxID=104270 RepID=UPI003BA8DEF8
MSKEENNNTFIIIIVVVIVIIIYVVTLGLINIAEEREEKQEEKRNNDTKNNLSKLQSRYEKLKTLIQKKEKLNIKLNKKFKRIYFGIRFVLASLYVSYNAMLFFVFKITKIGDLLNWNQFALIIIALFSFIAFGTLTNVKDFIQNIKMRLESKTYDKYVNITEQLEIHKDEEIKLNNIIAKTQLSIPPQENTEDSLIKESIT